MVNRWIGKPLSEIADIKTGPFGSALHAEDYVNIGTPIITVEHLGDYSITRQNLPLVSDIDKHRLSAYTLKKGDIVFSRVGSVDRNAYVTENEDEWLFSGRLLRIRIFENDVVDAKYLSYFFKFENTKARIYSVAVGQTMASLNTKIMNDFIIEYPPLPEQRRIAEVLSDIDALISALEKLIAKKRAIKQGVMQELLTGKRRLDGFSGKWVEKKLGEIVDVYDNLRIPVDESLRVKGRIPYYGANGIQDYVDGYTHDGEFVLLAEDGANDLLNYPVSYVCGQVWVNNHAHIIRGIAGVADTKYLSYALKAVDFQSVLVGGTRAKLNGSVMRCIEILIPTDTTEQTVIASILSDMDAEIDVLTTKLNKLRNIKQGMMNELLTGHIRLTATETSEVVAQKAKIILLPTTESKPIATPSRIGHNEQFDDAVAFAEIADKFYHPSYTLGRVRMYKLLYLFRRHQEVKISGFTKMAAGPYKSDARYKGGEKIAIKNGYIIETKSKEGFAVSKGKNISAALKYSEEWQWQDAVKWLISNFKYKSRNDLETLATVDMAACELLEASKAIDLQSVKEVIHSNLEWKPKLSKPYFSDMNILRAIKWSNDLFGQEDKPE